MTETDFFARSLRLPDINTLKDGQMSGALSGRMAQLFEMLNENNTVSQAPIMVDPGDHIRIGDDGTPGLALSLPIAYDIWYLWHTVNVLPADDQDRALFVDLVLNPFLLELGGLKPLRTLAKSNLVPGEITNGSFFEKNGYYYIKEMRFETFLKDKAPEHTSPGPKRINEPGKDQDGSGPGDIYSAYLAFPVGPLGVMEDISLVYESMAHEGEYDSSYDAVPGKGLLPPKESLSVKCKGFPLFEKAYLPTGLDTEYPAAAMNGHDTISPHHWLRYWIAKDSVYPIPGEFVGISVKPLAIPPHCWWFQETSPFLYSGNWFETDYYTSGIIIAVIEYINKTQYVVSKVSGKHPQRTGTRDHILSEGTEFSFDMVGNIYKVRVKDQDLYLQSTDFKEYFVDDRVAIIKRFETHSENFKWTGLSPGKLIPGQGVESLQNYDIQTSGSLFQLNKSWVIAPITFYKE